MSGRHITADRNSSVDTLKFLLVIAVIIIHSGPSYYAGPAAVPLIRSVCGLAVPVFFSFAGFFFGRSLAKGVSLGELYQRYVLRLLIVFAWWSIIYSLPPVNEALIKSVAQYGWLRTYYWHYTDAFNYHPIFLFMGGTAGHLWFLSALIQAITIVAVFLRYKQERALIYLALFMYLMMPVVNVYAQFGPHEEYTWNPVVGPFEATANVVFGWWMSTRKDCSLRLAAGLFLVGMMYTEIHKWFIVHVYHIGIIYTNYGLLLESAGLAMAAVIYPHWGRGTVMPRLGQWTLGVYCAHVLFVDFFKLFRPLINPWVWDLLVPLGIYTLSLGLTVILLRIPLIRRIVQ